MTGLIMGVFNFFAEPIKKYVVDHLCYIVQVEDNVKALTREAGILEDKRNDVVEQIRKDDAALKKPTKEVEGWLKRANDLQPISRARQIQEDYESRNCMFGSCSFNCFSSHSIGMLAAEELSNVRVEVASIEGVKEYTVEVGRPVVQGRNTTTIEYGKKEFELKFNQAIQFLRGDINEKGILGVCGMGGIGKTTLLEHINNALEKSLSSFGFDRVVFVTASKECKDAKMFLKLLVKVLGLPETSEETDVFNYLRNKNFAVLVDDLWEYLDLKETGIPLPLGVAAGHYKRKLILTSRSFDMCCKMGADDQIINVDCLSQEDARQLFRAKAGLNNALISSDPALWELANDAADECDGLPIALIAIGRAMSGKEDVREWSHALELLRNSKLSKIPGIDDHLPLLKFSYDRLEERERGCLLHCALWPEDYKINKPELIQCWMGHGLLGEYDTMQEACNIGHLVINSLQRACLLESPNIVGMSGSRNHCVKLHDVIRDMALWIARDCGANENKWVVLSGGITVAAPQDRNTWREVHKMSLFSIGNSGLPSHILDCPNIVTLMAPYVVRDLSILQYMRGLKYLDLSHGFEWDAFPIEICGLKKLEYLNIGSKNLTTLPEDLKNLTNLKFLLCRETPICMVPADLILSLVNLFELDLFSRFDFVSQSWIIKQLVHSRLESTDRLKALGIHASSISDLQGLTRLSNSGVCIRALSIQGVEDLTSNSLDLLSSDSFGSQAMFSNLERLVMGHCGQHVKQVVFKGGYRLQNLEYFSLNSAPGLEDIIWKEVEPAAVFPRLRELCIMRCRLRHITWAVNLPYLEHLSVCMCKGMEQLVAWDGKDDEEDNPRISFPSLRIIHLMFLPELRRFSNGDLSLDSLEFMNVYDCPKLGSVPFKTPASCGNLRTIAGKSTWWEALQLKGNMRTFLQPIFQEISQ